MAVGRNAQPIQMNEKE